MGVVGKGGTCCFMCVVGAVILWGLRLLGRGWCDNLILARAGAFLMVRDVGLVLVNNIATLSVGAPYVGGVKEEPFW